MPLCFGMIIIAVVSVLVTDVGMIIIAVVSVLVTAV